MSIARSCSTLILSCAAVIVFAASASTQEFSVVVPNDFASTEGDAPGSPGEPTGWRLQYLVSSAQFSAVPSSMELIKSLSFRPDSSVTAPTSAFWGDLTLRLSTTTKSIQSNQFDDNLGEDLTTVYQGPITFLTQNVGPPEGPREFDVLIEFSTPFAYSSNDGNLVVDFVNVNPGSEGIALDLIGDTNGAVTFVGNDDASSGLAIYRGNGAVAMQFAFVPEPSSIIMCTLGFWGLLRRGKGRR